MASPVRDLQGDLERLAQGEWRAFETRLQGLALVQRHGDEQLPVGGRADLVNGADVGMIECRGCACFEQESLLRLGLRAQMRRQEFQRDVASQAFVTRAVHEAHGAGGERLDDEILRHGAPMPVHLVDTGAPERGRADLGRELIHEAGTLVRGQQRFHFPAEIRVIAALARQQRIAFGRLAFDGRAEQALHAQPPRIRHGITHWPAPG